MISLQISGEGARAAAEELARGLDDLGAPASEVQVEARVPGTRDALAVATFVLTIPPAILACWDLSERIGKIAAVRRWLGRLPAGTQVVVSEESSGRSAVVGAGDAAKMIDMASGAPAKPAWDVFLAYASPDAALALELHGALEVRGLRTFLDRRALRAGERWDFALVNAQASARGTVALLSPHFGAAWYQADEVQRAIQLKRAYERFLIPLYRDGRPQDPEAVPYGLHALEPLDLPGCGGVQGAAARIRDLLRGN